MFWALVFVLANGGHEDKATMVANCNGTMTVIARHANHHNGDVQYLLCTRLCETCVTRTATNTGADRFCEVDCIFLYYVTYGKRTNEIAVRGTKLIEACHMGAYYDRPLGRHRPH